ncbi:hypothetical protein C8A05DRAFT_37000, partial [Staphylotrichum tortipilum]
MAVASTNLNPGTLTTATATAPGGQPCCPHCGFGADLPPFDEAQTALASAQRQIADLQAQVRLLNQKAAAAVDRWADYEDELAKLRDKLNKTAAATAAAARPQTPTPQSQQQSSTTQQRTSLPTPPSSAAGLPTPSPSRASFLTTSAATRISALLT